MMKKASADILPECLIGKIVSYLSFKEAAKMSILSKTWLRSWFMHPNIDFKYLYNGRNLELEIVDTIMDRYRDGKIPIDKFELSYSDFSLISQHIDKWLDIALQNGIKYLFFEVHNFSLPIFTILAAKSLTELIVDWCTLMPVSFSSVTNCNSLRKLSLTHVKLDENMLQTLLNCCPLIVSFIFHYCWGFKKIELLNLQKIKSVSIKYLKIQNCEDIEEIDSSNLESLEYMGYKIPKLKIARQLKHLKINLQCFSSLKAAWFCNLRKLLSNSISCPEISLDFSQCNGINLTDLRLHQEVATPKVDVLNVNCTWSNGEYANSTSTWMNGQCRTFLDALLWSCHPRRLNIQSTSATFKCFINSLIYMKNISKYSHWHCQLRLKRAQVYIFDDNTSQSWQPVELNREELSIRSNCKWKMVNYYFLLDW
ncbi:putative F-box protein At3g58860 [Solanum stenotomum]|uniref:putative F-box protein At3g58860 n=1 Tax=Solanum stenotomum TaxID=172797 RepID=UPI0020D0C602|nr:putative F-box protein At3g58860 [Solanum stenotomum]